MKTIDQFYHLLPTACKKVVITMHQKPDADAMGSSLALRLFIEKFGHQVTVISPTNWPAWLNWMPGCDKVIDYERDAGKATEALNNAELLFCLDFNIFHRTKNMAKSLAAMQCVKVLIDHHQEPDAASFDYGISNVAKSSTAEMIYDFIVQSGGADKIDKETSECIYAGVVADTGSFRFRSAGTNTFKLVAHLKELGLEHEKVHDNLFDNFLENKIRFTGHVLLHCMEIFYEYNTALISIPKSDLFRFQVRTGETDGLVNFPQSIQGIKLVGLVIDRDEERKWSFRSKGGFDCNTFARNYFEGGGHYNAAGGRSSDSLAETVRKFKTIIKENEYLLK